MSFRISFNGVEYYVSWRDKTTKEIRFTHDRNRSHAIYLALFHMLRLETDAQLAEF